MLTLERLAADLRPVFRRHMILQAIVFGSYATGSASRRSDVDLLLVQRTPKRFLDRYDGLYRELCAQVKGAGIDLLIYTPEELEHLRDRPFVRRILSEGRIIYEH